MMLSSFPTKQPNHLQWFKAHEAAQMTVWWGMESTMSWKTWRNRAKKTEKIKYGCEIRQGECTYIRRYGRDNFSKPEVLCCGGCKYQHGYLSTIPLGSAKIYNKLFSRKTGFWRKGIGCILPREMRSHTCLSCNCVALPVAKFLETGRGLVQILTKGASSSGSN
jgi:hypothetical protein